MDSPVGTVCQGLDAGPVFIPHTEVLSWVFGVPVASPEQAGKPSPLLVTPGHPPALASAELGLELGS